MTSSELLQLIKKDEGQTIEFKLESEKQSDLAEVLLAFANAEGGHLLIGVSDDGQIVGVENPKAVVDRLHRATRRTDPSLHSHVTIQQAVHDGKVVIVAEVPDTLSATYSIAGQFKIREGSYNRQMNSADVIGHAVRRGQLDYETSPVPQAQLDDLSEVRIKDFLARRLRSSMPDRSLRELLIDMRAASMADDQKYHPTVAGLLYFGNWPQFYLNHATILAARLIGPRGVQINDRATIEGPLSDMIERAIQFVQRNTRQGLRIGVTSSGKAQEVDEYPAIAVREAITNACCHRDFLERSPIQLKIYDDRLVIGNPGGLLPGLDIAHLEGKHKTRNPLLADWLQAQGLVERFGIGIIRMNEAMKQAGLPLPILNNRPDWFEVTLMGPSDSFLRSDESAASEQATGALNKSSTNQSKNGAALWYQQSYTQWRAAP